MIYRVGIGLESNKTDAEEAAFRENYSQQLRGKKQQFMIVKWDTTL